MNMEDIRVDSRSEDHRLLDTEQEENRLAPADRYHLVYIIFYLLGVAALLPWNFFINAKQYFMYKLRNTSSEWSNDSSMSWTNESLFNYNQMMFENYVELAALLPTIVFMFINMATVKVISVKVRVGVSLSVIIVLFAVTLMLTFVNSDNWQNIFLIISIITVVLMNAGSSMVQGSVCGLAGMFPRRYMQAVMGGMSMGGVAAAIANIISISVHSSNPLSSGFLYFFTALIIIIMSLVAFFFLYRLDFSKFYLTEWSQKIESADELSHDDVMINDDVAENDDGILLRPSIDNRVNSNICFSYFIVFKQVWIEGLCIVIIFIISLSCYPAINSAIQSVTSSNGHASLWSSVYFVPVTCFLFFNVADLIGRVIAGFFNWAGEQSRRPVLLAVCCVRLVFIPLFMLCNVQPRFHLSVVFNNDYVPAITTILFGVSNGYLATLAMTNGPKFSDDEELAGCMMGFCMSIGLGLGALLSIIIRHSI